MTIIQQYRDAKRDAVKLQEQAKKELIGQFHAVANQLLAIQQELRDEFGVKVVIPTKPTARGKKSAATPVENKPAVNPVAIARIERKLATVIKKNLEKPSKLLDDRIYELEDELRLAQEG